MSWSHVCLLEWSLHSAVAKSSVWAECCAIHAFIYLLPRGWVGGAAVVVQLLRLGSCRYFLGVEVWEKQFRHPITLSQLTLVNGAVAINLSAPAPG